MVKLIGRIMDPEIGFTNFLNQIDTILYGRKSYELWGQYILQLKILMLKKDCGDEG